MAAPPSWEPADSEVPGDSWACAGAPTLPSARTIASAENGKRVILHPFVKEAAWQHKPRSRRYPAVSLCPGTAPARTAFMKRGPWCSSRMLPRACGARRFAVSARNTAPVVPLLRHTGTLFNDRRVAIELAYDPMVTLASRPRSTSSGSSGLFWRPTPTPCPSSRRRR